MMVRNHGMVKGYDTKVLGLNMRLPEISAAIAKVQLEKLTDILDLRRRNALILHDLFSQSNQVQNIKIPLEPKGSRYNWYLYTVTLDNKRDEIKSNLHKNGIGATVYYDPPVHMTPYYSKHYPNSNLKFTELASKSVLSLPVHQSLSEEEAKFIANKVIEIMQE
jgi:dTDP-4-amino-4,6-dideoxygalactose transaminase